MTSMYYKHSELDNLTEPFKELALNQREDVKSYSRIHIRDVEPSGFHNLPRNVLFSIFKYMPEEEIRRTIIPVCHKWRQVALLPELWQKITFRGFHVPSNFICQELRSFPDLKSISLINIHDVTTIIRQICRCNTRIEIIVMKYCRNDKVEERISERVLRNLITSCKRLQKIDLKGTQFSGNLFYIEVALLPFLKYIDLSNNRYLTTKNIFEFVLNCQQLEDFKLSYRNKNQYMSDNDAVFLFSNLRISLKSITFDMMELTDISFKTLFECEKLEKLYLYNVSNISSEVLSSISKKLSNLKHLKLHHSQISTNEIDHLVKGGLGNLNKLHTINLTGSLKLNSEGLQLLAKECPFLEKAVFRCCKNLENIECLIDNCRRIQILDIAFCSKLPNEVLLDTPLQLPLLITYYTDISRNYIAQKIKFAKQNLVIHICLSEFNKKLKRTI